MDSPISWIESTFSSAAKEDDLVKSRSLNITRVSAVVAPILTGIWTAISELTDKPPFNELGFQKQLVLAFIGLIAVVSVADMLSRAITATKQASQVAIASILPVPLKAKKDVPSKPDVDGHVVAFRSLNANEPARGGEYLFVSEDGAASWETSKELHL